MRSSNNQRTKSFWGVEYPVKCFKGVFPPPLPHKQSGSSRGLEVSKCAGFIMRNWKIRGSLTGQVGALYCALLENVTTIQDVCILVHATRSCGRQVMRIAFLLKNCRCTDDVPHERRELRICFIALLKVKLMMRVGWTDAMRRHLVWNIWRPTFCIISWDWCVVMLSVSVLISEHHDVVAVSYSGGSGSNIVARADFLRIFVVFLSPSATTTFRLFPIDYWKWSWPVFSVCCAVLRCAVCGEGPRHDNDLTQMAGTVAAFWAAEARFPHGHSLCSASYRVII
jgi:hypothetical protein